jgi:hypothetical protein
VKVGDLVRITSEGAVNIDEVGIHKGSVGIIVKVEPDDPCEDYRDMGDLYTIIANNRRIPYLFDCEIEKV